MVYILPDLLVCCSWCQTYILVSQIRKGSVLEFYLLSKYLMKSQEKTKTWNEFSYSHSTRKRNDHKIIPRYKKPWRILLFNSWHNSANIRTYIKIYVFLGALFYGNANTELLKNADFESSSFSGNWQASDCIMTVHSEDKYHGSHCVMISNRYDLGSF